MGMEVASVLLITLPSPSSPRRHRRSTPLRSPMSKRAYYKRPVIADDAGATVAERDWYGDRLKILITKRADARGLDCSIFDVNRATLIICALMAVEVSAK